MSAHSNIAGSLAAKQCTAAPQPLPKEQITALLPMLDGWTQQNNAICKTFTFENYHQTMSFVNATAWISGRENHHPELTVSYSKCHMEYTTHAVNGLSENDFICAAKIDALLSI